MVGGRCDGPTFVELLVAKSSDDRELLGRVRSVNYILVRIRDLIERA